MYKSRVYGEEFTTEGWEHDEMWYAIEQLEIKSRKELIRLIEKFNIKYTAENWLVLVSNEDFIDQLLFDAPKQELLKALNSNLYRK